MNDSIKQLKEKIEKVSKDIEHLSGTGSNLQGIGTLASYKEYLEDELRLAEQAERLNGKK
jgi:hypothetical protein